MARSRSLLTSAVALALVVVACTSSPETGGGSGGAGSGEGNPSGGAAATGGSAAGGASSGGASSGGTSSGGATDDGGGGLGSGGLGGETATGGADSSGGANGSGGTGGTRSVGYGPCDEDLGRENNPGCGDEELCVENACTELCPEFDLDAALAYECPARPPGGEAESRCQTFIGRCILLCALQGLTEYSCPDGMICVGEACGWPD